MTARRARNAAHAMLDRLLPLVGRDPAENSPLEVELGLIAKARRLIPMPAARFHSERTAAHVEEHRRYELQVRARRLLRKIRRARAISARQARAEAKAAAKVRRLHDRAIAAAARKAREEGKAAVRAALLRFRAIATAARKSLGNARVDVEARRLRRGDPVITKTGRRGVVSSLRRREGLVYVAWEDGERFAIQAVHLQIAGSAAAERGQFAAPLEARSAAER